MKHSDIVQQNLVGLNYFPPVFPSHIWDQEFGNTDIELFKRAVRKIRSTFSAFPTYSDVREVMASIQSEDHLKKQYQESQFQEQDVPKAEQRREVFRKWYKWLKSYDHATPEILVEYYTGCAEDYKKIGGDSTFMYEAEKLYEEAAKQQRIIDARSENEQPTQSR